MLRESAAKFVKRDFADQSAQRTVEVLDRLPNTMGSSSRPWSRRSRLSAGARGADRSATFLSVAMGGRSPPGRPGRAADSSGESARYRSTAEFAVGHLHAHGLLHEDVESRRTSSSLRDGRVNLVDFNVSTTLSDTSDTTTGTVPYRPEDFRQWTSRIPDAYATCVVLAELLAGRPLGSSAPDWIIGHPTLHPDGLSQLLERGLGPGKSALRRTNCCPHWKGSMTTRRRREESIRFSCRMTTRTGRIGTGIRLSSEDCSPRARRPTPGTRGLDEFGAWAYVPTHLDEELQPDVTTRQLLVVVVRGNAGDRKTAFIQMLERSLRSAARG